jgi:purine-nucleoside phosphorylase
MSTAPPVRDLTAMTVAIRAHTALVPAAAILLGTGLGALGEAITSEVRLPFSAIPGMPLPTAASHQGEMVIGHLAGVPVVSFSGRLHCYEGYAPADVVVPVRLARRLGAPVLIMGSAVGGLDPDLVTGDLAVITDHLNLMGVNPLVGPNDDAIGPRWPDMSAPYDLRLVELAGAAALARGISLHRCVYAGVLGPNLETRAEYRMLRTLGADIVGMSTVPEAIAAAHCGLRTLAFAVVTDRCLPDCLAPADIASIIAVANAAEPVLTGLVADLLPRLAG